MDGCKVCAHPRLDDIHRAIDAKRGVNATAADYGIPPTTLKRHLGHRTTETRPPAPAAEPIEELPRADGWPLRRPGGQCAVCESPAAAAIEHAILRGEAAAAIERAHPGGPSAESIRGHASRCIPELLGAARTSRLAELCDQARSVAEELVTKARAMMDDVLAGGEEGGSHRDRAAVLAAACRALELLAKITGELGRDREAELLKSPQWALFQTRLVEILRDFPEARARVIEAMRALEG